MPEGTTFTDIHRKFRDNPDLYRYICALDLYIDELALYIDELEKKNKMEEFFTATANPPPNVVLMYRDDLKENQKEKLEKTPHKSKFQRKLDEALAKREEAKKAKADKPKT